MVFGESYGLWSNAKTIYTVELICSCKQYVSFNKFRKAGNFTWCKRTLHNCARMARFVGHVRYIVECWHVPFLNLYTYSYMYMCMNVACSHVLEKINLNLDIVSQIHVWQNLDIVSQIHVWQNFCFMWYNVFYMCSCMKGTKYAM